MRVSISSAWRWAAGVLLAAGLTYAVSPAQSGKPAPPPSAPKFKPVGLVGCASSNCHGRPDAGGSDAWKASCSVWSALDPHANAYAALGSSRNTTAKRIEDAFKKQNPDYKATEDARCLACHTNPSLAAPADGIVTPSALAGLRAEGVGCEACHGNAEGWQLAHTGWTTAEKRSAGIAATLMAELNDLGERAKACAGCHVGAPADPARGYPARDMNHDMIAAGHPRLVFEFATHLYRLPKHWQEKDRTRSKPRPGGWEYQAWLVGQLATAEAVCELTADRATRALAGDPRSPWPEFADWNCYGCHHDLVPQGWRAKAGLIPGRKPGALTWELPWPADKANLPTDAAAARQVAAMSAKVYRAERPAAAEMPPADAAQKALRIFQATTSGPLSWDDAYRAYLGLIALDLAGPGAAAAKPQAPDLATLAGMLKLPGHPVEKDYTPQQVREQIGRVVARLRQDAPDVRK